MFFVRTTRRRDFAETLQTAPPSRTGPSGDGQDALERLACIDRSDRILVLMVGSVGAVTLMLAAASALP